MPAGDLNMLASARTAKQLTRLLVMFAAAATARFIVFALLLRAGFRRAVAAGVRFRVEAIDPAWPDAQIHRRTNPVQDLRRQQHQNEEGFRHGGEL